MTGPAAVPLARLMGMGFRLLIDDLHDRLAAQGWRDIRPAYGFALLAIRDGETTTTELARLLGVTKQATSKLQAPAIHVASSGAQTARTHPAQQHRTPRTNASPSRTGKGPGVRSPAVKP